MAEISSIRFKEDGNFITLKIAMEEYELLKQSTKDILLIPADPKSLDRPMTTGRLGNSTRMMLPKRVMDKLGVKAVSKKAPGRVFSINGRTFVLAKICEKAK